LSGPTGYLLDTNVLSEMSKKRPERKVVEFIQGCDESALYLSVLTIGELLRGVIQKQRIDPDAARELAKWVDGLQSEFGDRLLSVDAATAQQWGEWSADRSRPVIDTLIAATAQQNGLTLVTRNTKDVRGLHVAVLNPWTK
jgi:hypothetical protein